jgi:hypothetical protein
MDDIWSERSVSCLWYLVSVFAALTYPGLRSDVADD